MTLLGAALVAAFGSAACGATETNANESTLEQPAQAPARQERKMKIRIRMGHTAHLAILADRPAARDFASLLPLTLTLEDYNATEKIADLPRKLSSEGSPEGHDPSAGDITYYAPWGNLAIFYRDFHYSRGLVRLGRIETGVAALDSLEGPVTIEAVEQQPHN